MRRRREKTASRSLGWRAGLLAALVLSLLAALGGLSLSYGAASLTQGLPSLELITLLLDPTDGELLQPSRIYDRSGERVLYTFENPAAGPRRFLPVSLEAPGVPLRLANRDRVSPALVEATLAIADPYFREHPGFSLAGLREGVPSTLAQRLVSNLLLWDEPPSFRRSLRERLLAYQLTARFGREQVLAWYLNSAYYGRQAYGAEAAAQVYFGKSAADLNLAEAAFLAAASDTPSLNPHDAPQAAVERQQQVIQVMYDRGLVSEEEALQALTSQLSFRPPIPSAQNPAPAFTGLVIDELLKTGASDRLQRGGVRVVTTLDSRLQAQAACTAEIQIARLRASAGSSPGPEGQDECEAARLLPTLPDETAADDTAGQNLDPETEVVLLDPRNGQVLAFYGTLDTLALTAERSGAASLSSAASLSGAISHPSGTLWTPVIYLTAFARGLSPASLVWDIPADGANGEPGSTLSPEGDYHGPVRLRIALVNDYLTPAAKILEQVGQENVWETARELGLASNGEPGEEIAASSPVNGPPLTLLQAARAYGIFANHGSLGGARAEAGQDPVTILKIEDYQGAPWPAGKNTGTETGRERPVLSPQLAYLLTHILSDETARWPSLGHPNPFEIGRPAAVKSGRAPDGQAAWAVGYIPQLVLGVWLGGDPGQRDSAPPAFEGAAENAAAGIWHALMQYASRDWPAQGWTPPEGITRLEVCDPSGLLPGADCPNIVPEVFLAGTEPTHFDSLFRALQINRETGRLATIFTPLDLVEEKVFLLVPPEAKPWAVQAGLPIPPQEYDLAPAPVPASPEVQINSPALFAYVRGEVPILGRAGGEDFDYYRLQMGKGLNPGQWQRIGGDMRTPVSEGRLGVWDTEGLDGLYALELLVVHSDQTVASAVIQVTVDNQPPELAILNPLDGQEIDPAGKRYLTFQLQAEDNLALKKVELYVDDQSFVTLVQEPYSAPWRVQAGEHTLRVVATDLAGNQAEATVLFTVNGE
jgi:membrane peptidoglycan carboxypeptidase